MDEVTVSTTSALTLIILSATCLSEVSDRRELAHDGTPCIETTIELSKGILCIFFFVEFGIQVTRKMVSKIASNVHFFYFSK